MTHKTYRKSRIEKYFKDLCEKAWLIELMFLYRVKKGLNFQKYEY